MQQLYERGQDKERLNEYDHGQYHMEYVHPSNIVKNV